MRYIKNLVWVLIAVALVVVAVNAVKKKKALEASRLVAKEYKINVDTLTLVKEHSLLTLPYLAIVMNDNDGDIATKISSRVTYIKKIGTSVKKGEMLVKLDDTDLKAKLQALTIGINSLGINKKAQEEVLSNLFLIHKRTKELLDVKGASLEEYQNEESKISLTKAKVQTLRGEIKINTAKIKELKNLIKYATLKANTDGIVSKTFVSKGEVAMAGHPILSISSEAGKYLLINLPQTQDIKEILYNQKVYAVTPLYSTINGLKQYKAEVNCLESVGEKVDIQVVVYDDIGIKVPLDAILQTNSKNYIFIVQQGKAIQEEIEVVCSAQEGYIIDSKYENKKIVLAKPDIFLKLISGLEIKE